MDYQQIKQLKTQYPDALMFMRVGDFYEVFAQDALTVSKELELTLTGRNLQGSTERIPMAGVPFHSVEQYIAKLIAKGYKVAVVENLESIKQTLQQDNNIKENKKMDQNVNVTPYTEEERAEIVGQSKDLFNEILDKDNLKGLLCTIGRNGKYTLNNTLFMLTKAPEISVVKNMADWNDLGRTIIPNSKSLEIMAPIKEERTAELKGGEEPQFDENGQQITKKYSATTGFKPSYVFDISQTQGKDYSPFKLTDKVTDEEKRIILKGVRNELGKRGYKIDFVDADKFNENENGRVNRKAKKVEIRKGMDNRATCISLLHESANALISAMKYRDFEGLKGEEAYMLESSCMDCVLAAHFGMSTEKFDFSFTSAWDDAEKGAFYNNANLICLSTTRLMEGVDHAFAYNAANKQEQGVASSSQPSANRPSLFRGLNKQSEVVAS